MYCFFIVVRLKKRRSAKFTKYHEEHDGTSDFVSMLEEKSVKIVLDEAFAIHKRIGPGMLESVYKMCLAYRLEQKGLFIEIEKQYQLSLRK